MPQGNPKAGEMYLHFKGHLYQVLSVAKHTETGELLVIYQALYGDYGVYARPYSMFISDVDHEKYPDAKAKHRFTLVDPEALSQIAPDRTGRSYLSGEQSASEQGTSRKSASMTVPDSGKVTSAGEKNDEEGANPLLLKFLDADSFHEKYKILQEMKEELDLDDALLDNLAASMDVVIPDGQMEERIRRLEYAITKKMQFETDRFRR